MVLLCSASSRVAVLLWIFQVISFANGHGTMVAPLPRQPESVYWYQVGCMIGCGCSGGGKEEYPSPESVGCTTPAVPSLNGNTEVLTFNALGASPRGAWNEHMPWRFPGSSKPIDSCGIASGFLPTAEVQYPHRFAAGENIEQGYRGTLLPPGPVTRWEAGSIAEVSFYLVVNHGGGYQYRVCPKSGNDDGAAVTESCFEQNPLVFADGVHTVFRGDKTPIEIPATDVSIGVIPEGSTWRRIPLPACNCDSGNTNCSEDNHRDFDVSYSTPGGGPYGSCPTGLQFVPPHISDGLWPEGYGYYVARLASADDDKGKGGSSSVCSGHAEPSVCLEDREHGCRWYTEKNVCYETRDSGGESSTKTTTGVCLDHTDEDSCLSGTENGETCTWYESPEKTVCYYAGEDKGGDGKSSSGEGGEWHITDRVYAPAEPGEYILQWRWDNEQTPQIWTTCADIEVVPEGQEPPQQQQAAPTGESDGGSNAATPHHRSFFLVAGTMLLLPAVLCHLL